ncbi:metallophosphoesterase [Marmoricola sp. RAF53]|uniref:metallophosphoesterase n=1 Tax=Marmoricola sp. RAF53 TaxID=3233059 RepID=UPI003F94911A
MRIPLFPVVAASAALIAFPLAAKAAPADTGKTSTQGSFAYAVYGDAPYGVNPTDTSETAATPAFIDTVNADPDVSAVVHVGDIHSGKQYCTERYDRQVAELWSHFADPVVYTPGDNEWTDCHKAAEGGGTYNKTTGQVDLVRDAHGDPVDYAGGNPVANLALIRSIFFPRAGATLGRGDLRTLSQATAFDPAYPADAQYIENVIWKRKGFVFVTLNIPGGSNNDTDPWYGASSMSADQAAESTARTAADLRWLDRAFQVATDQDAQGVVIVQQADMWDLDGKAVTHLGQYEPLVSSIAAHTRAFARPVLALEGDSHVYRSDNPLQQNSDCTGDGTVCDSDAWTSHPGYDVPNFHRIVVHGSTVPLEYLKLTVTPGAGKRATTATSFGPFSWSRRMES